MDQKTDHSLFKKNNKNLKLKFDNKKINILVAAHCFSDAIHAFGDNIHRLSWLAWISEKFLKKEIINVYQNTSCSIW